jgi:hypothetical protein
MALAMVHGRGLSIGDLHPGNVIVRPDNTIALIDYELAGEGTSWSGRGLVTAGYAAPGVTAGADADWFALERMRLTMLLPLTSLVVHDASKVATLVDAATAELPVAQSTGGRLRRVAGHGCSPVAVDHAGSMFAAGETGWPAAEAAIVAAIQGSATPNRRDRLFPGDPALFATGGTDVACGAAGVLYALHRTGNPVVGEHIDWLATQALRVPDPVGGLYGGLHGTAVVLDLLGRRAQALDVLARVRGHDSCGGKAGIHSGLAGVALSLLHFASRTGDADMLGGAQILASRLADAFDGSGDHPDVRLPDRPGLMWGATGVAALFIRMFEHTGEPWYLDRAYACLCRDLAHCAPRSPGTLYVREGPRNLPHLDTGSLGLAVVASRYLRHRYTPDLAAAVAAASRACDAAVVFQSGIQQGRAGLILGLANISDAAQADTIHRHIRRLGWHALNHRDGIAFPGAQLLRLSMDLFTGSAGILLAVHAAIRGDGSFLPTLDAAEHSDPVPEGGETP